MSLIKRNGWSTLDMPTLFNDFFTKDLWDWGMSNNSITNTTIPAINVKETNDDYVVEVAAPGMQKDDFKIELDGNMLTIRSEKEERHEDKDGEKYTRREFSYQSFQRTFQLPKDVVDDDKIQARYENGLLHLVIPKREHAKQKPPRSIEIS
jgi:HSP20 family protein